MSKKLSILLRSARKGNFMSICKWKASASFSKDQILRQHYRLSLDRSNHRPISALPVLSRLLEKLVYDHLYNHLDKNKLLYIFPSGFRTLHLVVTCLLKSTNDWYVNIDNSKVSAVIFIDFKKAFDSVDPGILLGKLHHYGINGIEHDWFRSYLNNRKQSCKANGESSTIQSIEIGVPQGSCLGPLLFLLYIDDLLIALSEAHATVYADDTTISYSSDNMKDLVAVVNSELSAQLSTKCACKYNTILLIERHREIADVLLLRF